MVAEELEHVRPAASDHFGEFGYGDGSHVAGFDVGDHAKEFFGVVLRSLFAAVFEPQELSDEEAAELAGFGLDASLASEVAADDVVEEKGDIVTGVDFEVYDSFESLPVGVGSVGGVEGFVASLVWYVGNPFGVRAVVWDEVDVSGEHGIRPVRLVADASVPG